MFNNYTLRALFKILIVYIAITFYIGFIFLGVYMCFSAISSFSASIIIGGIGVSTVKKTTAK